MTFIYGLVAFSMLVLAMNSTDRRISSQLFLLYGIILCLLVLFKPFGSAPDDLNYTKLAALGCTSEACDDTLSLNRDFIWFFLASFSPANGEFLAVKIIALLSLVIKLYVIFKLSSNKMYALCIYTFAFYFLHDLTQYRVSLAIAFFLLAIFFASRSRGFNSSLSYIASVGSHIQSAPSAMLLMLPDWVKRRRNLLWLILAILTLIAMGIFPPVDWLVAAYGFVTGQDYDISSDIGKYIYLSESDAYFGMRNVSLISVVIMFSLWVLKFDGVATARLNSTQMRAISISCGSIVMAYMVYLAFASVLDMQNRLFEYFLVPLVIVFGNCQHTARNYFTLTFLCMSMFIKYHVISTFFSS
jgi:hypothetical protein